MMSKALVQAVNDQIQKEISSAYLYLSMSAACESMNLSGAAKWLRLQWQEELDHAMKLYDMLHTRGAKVTLQAIEKPAGAFKSLLDIFQQVVAHEQKVTASINALYSLAAKESDLPTQMELGWFIKEQVEEEKNAGEIVAQLKMVGESGPTLLMLDRALGARASS